MNLQVFWRINFSFTLYHSRFYCFGWLHLPRTTSYYAHIPFIIHLMLHLTTCLAFIHNYCLIFLDLFESLLCFVLLMFWVADSVKKTLHLQPLCYSFLQGEYTLNWHIWAKCMLMSGVECLLFIMHSSLFAVGLRWNWMCWFVNSFFGYHQHAVW